MLYLGINLFWFLVLIPTEKFINKTDPLNPYREGSVKSWTGLKVALDKSQHTLLEFDGICLEKIMF